MENIMPIEQTGSETGSAAPFHGFRSFEARGGALESSWQAGRLEVRDARRYEPLAAFAVTHGPRPVLRLAESYVETEACADAAIATLEAITTQWGATAVDIDIEHQPTRALLHRRASERRRMGVTRSSNIISSLVSVGTPAASWRRLIIANRRRLLQGSDRTLRIFIPQQISSPGNASIARYFLDTNN
jgi:hypothetical protein